MAHGHTNLGAQKSSVDQFGKSKESAHSKSEKMEAYHKEYMKKKNQ